MDSVKLQHSSYRFHHDHYLVTFTVDSTGARQWVMASCDSGVENASLWARPTCARHDFPLPQFPAHSRPT